MKFTFEFVVADVSKSIIGSDFLKRFGLSIEYYNEQLSYHPGTPQHHTLFHGYHKVDWDRGEVHTVQPGPWMQTAAYTPTKIEVICI